ncbi:MAG: HlyD family efflux transporter periplasmic adaptor subunit [Bacteroidales bacterium]|jgi:HlyD family secretion protein|nr:HlyD family efflux transporter periplasmic adaptor subunit [Bacteroidales bacterium]
MYKKILLFGIPLALIVVAYLIFGRETTVDTASLTFTVSPSQFDIIVTTTGELQAENSEEIMGPEGLRRARIYTVKITDLIPEGTVVDSGDYVASLDRTELTRLLKENELEIQKVENQLKSTELDTTLSLRGSREELVNLKFAYEEGKIKLEQSKFEPPATIRQAEIDLLKSERSFEQAVENYEIKTEQAVTKMKEVESQLAKVRQTTQDLLDIANQFTVLAPKKGMVIYKKEWGGRKRQVGSEINPWDPGVATLPDLSKLISKVYINEVDISKVKVGQEAMIGIDAFPDKKIKGEVIKVANVGEQKPNSDAKVFEVQIRLEHSDSILKPSMTTSNQIFVNSFDSVLFVPIDAVFADKGQVVVYKKRSGSFKKTEVKTGESNENFVVITEGVEAGDIISLNRQE